MKNWKTLVKFSRTQNSMRVLSFDPGYERLGVSVMEDGQKLPVIIYSECFKTSKDLPQAKRLENISEKITSLISEFKPDVISLEKLFFQKNQKTALKVAEVRGIILSLASLSGAEVVEFSPQDIKIAVTGYGNADKRSVMKMVPILVSGLKKTESDDEIDAVAIGVATISTRAFHRK